MKKQVGRPKTNTRGEAKSVYLSSDNAKRLTEFMDSQLVKPTISAVVNQALDKFLPKSKKVGK